MEIMDSNKNIIEYEKREGITGSYIVFRIDDNRVDCVEVKMLENNSIPGILICDFRYEDNRLYLYYDITDKVALSEKVKGEKITYSVLSKIYNAVLQLVKNCEKYLISTDSILIVQDLIYVSRNYKEILFCALPECKNSFRKQIKSLTQELMKMTDHSDKKAVDFIYGMYNIVSNDTFYINDIKEFLNEKEIDFDIKNYKQNNEIKDYKINKRQSKSKDKELNNNNSSLNKTESFSLVRGRIKNILVREFVPEIIEVKKAVSFGCAAEEMLSVGRDETNEIVLPQNYISRKHAVLEADENFLYVTDKGSSNGTFVNGEKLTANVKTRCHVQDEITFADISFIVV